MKVVKPIIIDEAVLTASSIQEPDFIAGEVEWVNPLNPTEDIINPSTAKAAVRSGNFIYFIHANSGILKLNTQDDTTTLIPLSSGPYDAATTGLDGNIYCVGDSGDVLKIDTSNDTTSTFGSTSNFYNTAVLSSNGFIYCVGSQDFCLKINVSSGSISEFAIPPTGASTYFGSTLANNGFIYCVGNTGAVLEINTINDSTSVFGSYGPVSPSNHGYNTLSLANNGKIYGVGNLNNVLEIDVNNRSSSVFGTYSGEYNASVLSMGHGGDIVCVGDNKAPLRINTETKALSYFEKLTNNYECAAVSTGLAIYCGNLTGKIAKLSPEQVVGDRRVISSSHKLYECVISTNDNPSDGVNKIPQTWVFVAPTNKWAAFDDKISTTSNTTTQYSIQLVPGVTIDTISAFRVSGVTELHITATSASAGEVYNETISLLDIDSAYDFYTWYTYELDYISEIVIIDIPPYPDLTIDLVFNGTQIMVGNIVTGRKRDLGVLQANASSDRIDYSKSTFDDFGEETYVKRPLVKYSTYPIVVEKKTAPSIERYLDSLQGVQCVWVGGIGDNQTLTTFGSIERSPLVYSNLSISEYQIKVRGSI